jgi:hypothetical protein
MDSGVKLRSVQRSVFGLLFLVTAAAMAAGCGSSSSPSASASSAAATPPVSAATGQIPPLTHQPIVTGGIAPGTSAICDALTQNPELPQLLGVTNPPKSVFASGTIVQNEPGCQVGLNHAFTHGVVSGAFCHYSDPANLVQGASKWGTSDIYATVMPTTFLIITGPTTAVTLTVFPGGSWTRSVMVPALTSAARIFAANGGCGSR